MIRINIKPLSLNEAYRGRRFKTANLENYKKTLHYLLPKKKIPKGQLSVSYVFGVSSKGADGDNLIKCFQDALAEKYSFNDNTIYEWHIVKTIVGRGDEFVEFDIKTYKC